MPYIFPLNSSLIELHHCKESQHNESEISKEIKDKDATHWTIQFCNYQKFGHSKKIRCCSPQPLSAEVTNIIHLCAQQCPVPKTSLRRTDPLTALSPQIRRPESHLTVLHLRLWADCLCSSQFVFKP